MRKDVVPVFTASAHQFNDDPSPTHHVSRAVAVRLMIDNKVKPIVRGHGKNEEVIGLIQKSEQDVTFQTDPATLTFGDVQRNAFAYLKRLKGGQGRTLRMSEERMRSESILAPDAVEESVCKVSVWPEIGDTKAIRVGPRPTAPHYLVTRKFYKRPARVTPALA